MNATVPHADDVGGELMAVAQPLVLLGWSEPSVLTARVALERAVYAAIDSYGLADKLPPRPKMYQRVRELRRRRIVCDAFSSEFAELYHELSNVSHGKVVSLFEAVGLIEAAQRQTEELQELIG